jgi:hypothetical protein
VFQYVDCSVAGYSHPQAFEGQINSTIVGPVYQSVIQSCKYNQSSSSFTPEMPFRPIRTKLSNNKSPLDIGHPVEVAKTKKKKCQMFSDDTRNAASLSYLVLQSVSFARKLFRFHDYTLSYAPAVPSSACFCFKNAINTIRKTRGVFSHSLIERSVCSRSIPLCR